MVILEHDDAYVFESLVVHNPIIWDLMVLHLRIDESRD